MATQQLTVFLDPETYELLMLLRREGHFTTDDDVIRAALHSLHHDWQGSALPPRHFGLFSQTASQIAVIQDEILMHSPCMTPEDYDT